MTTEPAITTYGTKNAQAPAQLNVFSFFVGKWKGVKEIGLPDGSHGEAEWTWIGRYILDGMAIADELHATAPDGSRYLGITLRQFDTKHGSWLIEFLNVSGSFLRRQVNPRSGSVRVDGGTVVVISEDGEKRIRENYHVVDHEHFTYNMEASSDAGKSWDPPAFEMAMTRLE